MSAHEACAVSAETPTTTITESLRSVVMVSTGGFPPVESGGNVTLRSAGASVILTKDEHPGAFWEGAATTHPSRELTSVADTLADSNRRASDCDGVIAATLPGRRAGSDFTTTYPQTCGRGCP